MPEKQRQMSEKATRQIDRPMPTEAQKPGLLKVQSVEVTFSGGSKRQQNAALDHINDLIAFWNLRYREWKT